MRIKVRTTGLLGKYLPPGSVKNLAELEVADGATPFDVIKQLGMPLDGNYLVALNGNVVPKSERDTRTLAENDKLSIMPPLKGG
ncbi:MAG: MoaD/ThiS family protein [Acidiferrobacterales bacterium]